MSLPSPHRREDSSAGEIALAFGRYQYLVKRWLLVHGVRHADVDDAVQQVFLVIHRRMDEYRKVTKKGPWLFVVSRLVARNYLRALRRAKLRALRYLPTPPATLEEILIRREAARELLLLLHRLDETDRRVFVHADLEGLSAREIATELHMNVNTVYTRLRSARQQFVFGLRLRRGTVRSEVQGGRSTSPAADLYG